MPTLRFNQVNNFAFVSAVQKIANTPTHGQKASVIHKITKKLELAKTHVFKEWQSKIVDVYAKRDAEGKVIRPEGEPNGFEPMDEKMDEFMKAQEAFGEQEIEVDCPLVTLDLISDMKISATDLEALKGLYAGAPEVPAMPTNVASIR